MSNCPFVCPSTPLLFFLGSVSLISHIIEYLIKPLPFCNDLLYHIYFSWCIESPFDFEVKDFKYKICVFFVFYTFVFGLYFSKPFITIPNEPTGASITFEVKSSKILETNLSLIPYCRCCV